MSNEVVLAIEDYNDVVVEMKPLFEDHWEETETYTDKIKLSPDYDTYKLLNTAGGLHMVTARDPEGVLVGYLVSFLLNHHHYKDELCANNDIIYLDSKYRGTAVSSEMVMFAEEDLKDLGVTVFTISMKTKLPFDSLLEALDYSCVERVYSKYIKKEEGSV